MAPGLLLGLIGPDYLAVGYHMVMGPKHSIMNRVIQYTESQHQKCTFPGRNGTVNQAQGGSAGRANLHEQVSQTPASTPVQSTCTTLCGFA